MNAKTYKARRTELRRLVPKGAILLLALNEAPRNYLANTYAFRQDSSFLYYTGINLPDVALLIYPDGKEVYFGTADDVDTLIWMGAHPAPEEVAEGAGIEKAEAAANLPKAIEKLLAKKIAVHYLPPYRAEITLELACWFSKAMNEVAEGASRELIRAVVKQRSIKSDAEVVEIEDALGVTAAMYRAALSNIWAGRVEAEIAGLMQGVAASHNRAFSFLPIVSVRGEVLHNVHYHRTMKDGELMVIDAGAESPRFYAADITRTFPVSGRFTERQCAVYETVLAAQLAVIDAASPRVSNRDLHLLAARTITAGLKDIGLMKGDIDEAVATGAHALFFPHGIGHMLGLDVHDMEDLGDLVGYPEGEARSTQFGLSFLRLAKKLEPGFVITAEPGVYFNPPLIDIWENEKRHASFINYGEVKKYRRFGGIRIEDDLLITGDSCRVLGPSIPKMAEEIVTIMGC